MALCPAVIHVVNAYLIYRLFIFFFTPHHHSVNMVLFSFSHSSGLRYYIFSLEELHQTGSMLRAILLHFLTWLVSILLSNSKCILRLPLKRKVLYLCKSRFFLTPQKQRPHSFPALAPGLFPSFTN